MNTKNTQKTPMKRIVKGKNINPLFKPSKLSRNKLLKSIRNSKYNTNSIGPLLKEKINPMNKESIDFKNKIFQWKISFQSRKSIKMKFKALKNS
jgi:hypothetical protein